MTAAELLSECSRRGIRLRVEGDAIKCRPADALDDSLIESMRARKPELLAELRREAARDAAVAVAWERLRVAFEVAGRPDGWITGAVRDAEAVVSELWVSARQRPGDDARFYPAVERWLAIAVAAIRGRGVAMISKATMTGPAGASHGVGPWKPPGRVTPPHQCVRCGSGLAPGDPDGGLCSSCRWFFTTGPGRVQ